MDNVNETLPLILTSIENNNFSNLNSTIPLVPDNQIEFECNDQFSGEIDWVSLLSCFGDQQNSSPTVENNVERKKKKGGKGKKETTPRIAFHTRSADDILDDGYRWRKYGQKAVKNSIHQRSYYRCTQHTCNVKKQIQRLSKDSSIVATTYEGIHNHPSEKVMETLTPLLRQLQFLSRI